MIYKFFSPIAATIIGLGLTACSTVQTAETVPNEIKTKNLRSSSEVIPASKNGQAELIVSRVFAMPTRLKSRISIDGKEVGRLGNGEYLRVPISEGSREVKLHYNKLSLQKGDKIDLDVELGETYAFNIDSGFAGNLNTQYGNNVRVDVRLIRVSDDAPQTCCKLVP